MVHGGRGHWPQRPKAYLTTMTLWRRHHYNRLAGFEGDVCPTSSTPAAGIGPAEQFRLQGAAAAAARRSTAGCDGGRPGGGSRLPITVTKSAMRLIIAAWSSRTPQILARWAGGPDAPSRCRDCVSVADTLGRNSSQSPSEDGSCATAPGSDTPAFGGHRAAGGLLPSGRPAVGRNTSETRLLNVVTDDVELASAVMGHDMLGSRLVFGPVSRDQVPPAHLPADLRPRTRSAVPRRRGARNVRGAEFATAPDRDVSIAAAFDAIC